MLERKNEFTNDDPSKSATGAIKYDGGKAPIFRGVFDYFPRAIKAVAAVSAFGAAKYAWKGWEDVDNGYARYSDAMVRHVADEAEGAVLDADSGFPHAAHTAWNALARLELYLRDQEQLYLWATTSEEAAELVDRINNSYYLQPNKEPTVGQD